METVLRGPSRMRALGRRPHGGAAWPGRLPQLCRSDQAKRRLGWEKEMYKGLGPPARCPFSPVSFLVGRVRDPTKIDCRKKSGTLILSLFIGGPSKQ